MNRQHQQPSPFQPSFPPPRKKEQTSTQMCFLFFFFFWFPFHWTIAKLLSISMKNKIRPGFTDDDDRSKVRALTDCLPDFFFCVSASTPPFTLVPSLSSLPYSLFSLLFCRFNRQRTKLLPPPTPPTDLIRVQSPRSKHKTFNRIVQSQLPRQSLAKLQLNWRGGTSEVLFCCCLIENRVKTPRLSQLLLINLRALERLVNSQIVKAMRQHRKFVGGLPTNTKGSRDAYLCFAIKHARLMDVEIDLTVDSD